LKKRGTSAYGTRRFRRRLLPLSAAAVDEVDHARYDDGEERKDNGDSDEDVTVGEAASAGGGNGVEMLAS